MNSIIIKGNTAKNFIQSLADNFNTASQEAYGEYSVQLPKNIGEGIITGINFPSGVGLFRFEVKFKSPQVLDFCTPSVPPFKFLYILEGELLHQFKEEDLTHEIGKNQSVILGANFESGNKIYFQENTSYSLIMLDVDRKKFVEQLTFPLKEMEEVYYKIFSDTQANRKLYHHSQYSLKMAHLVSELKTFQHKGLEKTSFQGAKALELLTYMLMLYRDDNKNEELQNIIRPADLDKINNVVLTIDKNLSILGTISALAQEEKISEVKLQEGFQLLFNCSVNEYIIRKRLETAMQLLLKTDKTISEIVYDIGWNSRSHFSKIFKDKYGLTPKAVRVKK